ncbi:MAG TPA: hypothetical protein VE650_04175 [Acetobacteraceae bacterium]|jgi:hypothetical protein|nr:hypothetical protein [Acetobacteraceae bacterium]
MAFPPPLLAAAAIGLSGAAPAGSMAILCMALLAIVLGTVLARPPP